MGILRYSSKKIRQFNGILILLLMVSMVIPISLIPASSASLWTGDGQSHPYLTPKWRGFVAGGGEALLTADIVTTYNGVSHPGEEVIHAGGPVQPSSSPGRVTCMDGRNGNEIWRTSIVGIGDTAAINMADVDGDGRLEIMVALQHPAGFYVLNSEDGSILWRAPGTYNGNLGYITPIGGRIDGSGVAGDVDKDGNMDIFLGVMAYETQPNTGKLIHWEWNPSQATMVERQRVTVWHPCAGGLSLGDTDNDGTFELYMNERDVYFGDGAWGRGLTSFWADNLTKRWDHYEWGASSNIPMLADVNKDGVVDVVSTDLGRGIVVLNSTDGKPLKGAGGVTLYSASTGIRAHYQSTICDFDGDGNLEILTADGQESSDTQVYIWDLYNWRLDGTIPNVYSFRGPSVGEVTGDGQMDLIVLPFDRISASNIGEVRVYNRALQLLDSHGSLQHRVVGSVVQDIDRNDNGLNELLILTQGGVIYAFDTPGLSQERMGNARARSEVHFYSEARNGVSENLPFERPWPDVGFPNLGQGAVNVPTTLTQLSFRLNHPLGQLMSYQVTTYPNIGSGSGIDVGNGQRTFSISGLTPSTTYRWEIIAIDESGHETTRNYWFTTAPTITNNLPTHGVPVANSSAGGNTNIESLTAYNQTTVDGDGDPVTNIYNWYKNDISITNLNLPFDTQPNLDDISSGIYGKTAIARDYSGRGNNGNVSGATWVKGIVGGAYSFDGNDFIRIDEQGTSLGGGGTWSEMTMEFWVKATTPGSAERLIWKPDRYETSTYSYRLDYRYRSSPSQLEFTWYIATPSGTYSVPYILTTGVTDWHHIATTYKSGVGLKIYVDGIERAATANGIGNINATGGSNGSPLLIGFNSGTDFAGIVDEVRIYSTQISPFQINQRYLDTRGGTSDKSTIVMQELSVGDRWRCQVTPNDGFADGIQRYSNYITILAGNNTPPVAGNLTIVPSSPITTANLVANYSYYDQDGHPEYDSEIQWYKNNVFNMTGRQVPASYTTKGESWYYTLRPSDGITFGILSTSPTVIINNSLPSFTSVAISPDPAKATDMLTANSYGWTDSDNDAEGYRYQWQKLVLGAWQNITGATTKTLAPNNFASGDTLQVLCTAYDGQALGNTLSDTVFVISSNPPVQGTPNLLPTAPRNDEELTCTNQTTIDPDGDRVTNIYRWIRNSVSTTNLLMPFETNSSTTAKDYSNYNNNGNILGATWARNGKVGGAYSFDGNDVITVTDSTSLANGGTWSEITVEYWANPSVDQRGARIINKNGGAAGTSGKFMTGINTDAAGPANVIFFGVTIGTSYQETYSNTASAIPTGSWSHIVGTYRSGEGIKLYINGVLVASNTAVSGNIAASVGEPLLIGYASTIGGTANRYFRGMLDEIHIYPTALSAAQVFQNYLDTKDGSSNSATIVPQETTSGQTWRCEITPNDSWQDGTTLSSSTRTITTTNTQPRIDWYSPANTQLTTLIGNSINFMQVSSDPNGSPLSYSWTLDSVQQATTQNWTYTPTSASVHTIRVTVSDGTSSDYQEWSVDVLGSLPQYNLHVEASGLGTTNATGDSQYVSGTNVAVTATANTGWKLSHWLLNGTNAGSTNPYTLTMNNNYNLTAVFVPAEYNLTITNIGSGNVTINPSQATYAYGTNVTLTAFADAGWQFTQWSGDATGSSNPIVINMTSNKSVTATFTSTLQNYTLLVETRGLGTTNPSAGIHQYQQNTTATVSANASSTWIFNNWLLNGTNVGSTNPYLLNMNANYNLTAIFTELPPIQYNLHVQVNGQGTTNATGDVLYNNGTTINVLATPNSGWIFNNWLLNGTNTGTTNPYTITMNNNYNLTAVFTQPSQHLLSDDFESGSLVAWDGQDGTTAISIINPYQGTYHLSCSLSSGANNGWAGVYKSISGADPVYLSAYVQFNSPPNTNSEDQWVMAFTQSTAGNSLAYAGIRQVSGTLYWAIWYYSGTTLTYQVSSIVYTPGWHNLQLGFFRGTSGDGWVEFSVDGTLVCSAHDLDNDGRTLSYARVGFSYSDSPSSASTTVYIDDVTIDTQSTQPERYGLTIGIQGSGTTNPAVGTYQYDSGTITTITANPSAGWQFSSWLLNGTNAGVTNPYVLVMNSNYNLTAVFTEPPPVQYSLQVQVIGQGTTNTTGTGLYNLGTVVDIQATANTGWIFSHWLLNGTDVGSTNPYTLTMNANYDLIAVFTEVPLTQYQLRVEISGSGTTNATGNTIYNQGSQVSVFASANADWVFSNWLLNGTNVGSTNPYTVIMNANYNLTAVFTEVPPVQYMLHVQVSGSGTTNATGDNQYNSGTQITILATPNTNWTFSNWLLNGTNTGTTNPYTLTINNNYNLTAVFTQTPNQPLFYDGFESGNFNAWTGTTTTTGGTVAVNTARPFNGSYSGVYSINSGTGVRRAYSYININNTAELYTRTYVYIPNTLTLSNGQALWMIQYFNGATPLASYGIRADNTGMRWSVQYGNTPFAVGSAFPSIGGWYMLEAYFTHAATGKTIILFVNGTEVTSLSQSTTSLPNVNTVRVGIGYDAGTSALSLNIDEVTIDLGSPEIQAVLQIPYTNSVMSNDVKVNNGKGDDKKFA